MNKKSKRTFAKKHLGQNFLVDDNIKERIIEECEFQPNETVLEIGPGEGVLTEEIASKVKSVIAIEKDNALAEALQEKYKGTNTHVIHADFLKANLDKIPEGTKAVGNLPYNISSPILEKLIQNKEHFKELFLTVQLEFGQRMVAKHNTKDYSALSCLIRYYTDAEMLFKIRNSSFRPIPKVTSCFMKLTFRSLSVKAENEKLLFQIIHTGFQQRRKKISNSLSTIIPQEKLKDILPALNLKDTLRAENLSIEDYVNIANMAGRN